MPMVRFCTHCEAHAALELLLKEPVEGAPVARPAALTSAREVCRSMSCRRCASECTPDDSGLKNIFGRVKSCHKPPTLCFPRELLYTSWRAVCVKAVRRGVRSDIARREWLQSDALTAG